MYNMFEYLVFNIAFTYLLYILLSATIRHYDSLTFSSMPCHTDTPLGTEHFSEITRSAHL